ncbi:hypothetical protein EWM64_g4599 [Hericium alpestre]|uniref:Uncharacterized protein n=1 Tax=Hericium alpestre TaxID=135208 RepID=A0A4Y9ZZL0_9AGAM|nr:hypothetical protein EWM64_g4599 [Hericium alpestre]
MTSKRPTPPINTRFIRYPIPRQVYHPFTIISLSYVALQENPKLWYGIGILYDRYGSLDNAEEAFSSVLKMDKDFDKSNEVLFRLGIIYKQQTKYDESLRCFDRILRNPPSPLANADIWFQIGHVYEQQGDHLRAREAYERVVSENPVHAKVLQQLGWLYHQDGPSFQDQDLAIQYLTKSLEADPSDAQSWYLLGRAYMAGQKYNKAYEAYQQAVYRDGRNPTFWCSIGVLYFQINQFRDALDAYSRAIRINPYIPEVWFDLGSLYESCNNQISDAIDAYARAAELDPGNGAITQRLQLLKHSQATGAQLPAAPAPQDVHPTAYASAVVPPPGLGPPLMMHPTANGRPVFRADSRGPPEPSMPLPPPSQGGPARSSPAPFRGGPPPPVILDESRHGVSHTPLAPMDVDHIPPHARESNVYPPPRESVPGRNMNLLLHHSTPQGRELEPVRAAPPHAHDPFYPRNSRAPSIPASPPPHAARPRSPGASPYQTFHPGRATVGPAQSHPHPQSPRYSREASAVAAAEREQAWERRERERERERLGWGRPSGEFSSHPPPQPPYYGSRGPSPPPPAHRAHSPPRVARDQSPPRTSPMAAHVQSAPRGYWDIHGGPSAPPMQPPSPRVRPEPMQVDRSSRCPAAAAAFAGGSMRGSESPHMSQRGAPGAEQKRRRGAKDKEEPAGPGLPGPEPPKKERKRRTQTKRPKDDRGRTETPKPYLQDRLPPQQPPPFKVAYPAKPNESPEPVSSNGSGSQNRSVQPSPTSATALPPARVVDEDYDEGVAETLIGLSTYRAAPDQIAQYSGSTSGPALPLPQRLTQPSPSPSLASHRGSISSTRSRNSPPHSSGGPVNAMKRPLSPVPDEGENKRSKMEAPKRRASSPMPSSRPSPIPFRTQPPSHSHSPETRQMDKPKHPSYPSSPQLPAVLPPVPRPVGAGLSHNSAAGDREDVDGEWTLAFKLADRADDLAWQAVGGHEPSDRVSDGEDDFWTRCASTSWREA